MQPVDRHKKMRKTRTTSPQSRARDIEALIHDDGRFGSTVGLGPASTTPPTGGAVPHHHYHPSAAGGSGVIGSGGGDRRRSSPHGGIQSSRSSPMRKHRDPRNGGSPGKALYMGQPSSKAAASSKSHHQHVGGVNVEEAKATLEYISRLEKKVGLIEDEHKTLHHDLDEVNMEKDMLILSNNEQQRRMGIWEQEMENRSDLIGRAHESMVRVARQLHSTMKTVEKSQSGGSQAIVTTTAQAFVNNEIRELLIRNEDKNYQRSMDLHKAVSTIDAQIRTLERGMAARSAADAKLYSDEVSDMSLKVMKLVDAIETSGFDTGVPGSKRSKQGTRKGSPSKKSGGSMMKPPSSDEDEEDDSEDNAKKKKNKKWTKLMNVTEDEDGGGVSEAERLSHELRLFKTDLSSLVGRSEGSVTAQIKTLKSELINELSFLAPPKGESLGKNDVATSAVNPSLDEASLDTIASKVGDIVRTSSKETLEVVDRLLKMKDEQDRKHAEKEEEELQEIETAQKVAQTCVEDMRRESMEWRRSMHAAVAQVQGVLKSIDDAHKANHDAMKTHVDDVSSQATKIAELVAKVPSQSELQTLQQQQQKHLQELLKKEVSQVAPVATPAAAPTGTSTTESVIVVTDVRAAAEADAKLAMHLTTTFWRHIATLSEIAAESLPRKVDLLHTSCSMAVLAAMRPLPVPANFASTNLSRRNSQVVLAPLTRPGKNQSSPITPVESEQPQQQQQALREASPQPTNPVAQQRSSPVTFTTTSTRRTSQPKIIRRGSNSIDRAPSPAATETAPSPKPTEVPQPISTATATTTPTKGPNDGPTAASSSPAKYAQFASPYVPHSVQHHQPAKLKTMAQLLQESGLGLDGKPAEGGNANEDGAPPPPTTTTTTTTNNISPTQQLDVEQHTGYSSSSNIGGGIPTLTVKNEQSMILQEHMPAAAGSPRSNGGGGGGVIDDPIFAVDTTKPINDLHSPTSGAALAASPGTGLSSPPREQYIEGEPKIRDSATKRRVSSHNVIIPFSSVPVDTMSQQSMSACVTPATGQDTPTDISAGSVQPPPLLSIAGGGIGGGGLPATPIMSAAAAAAAQSATTPISASSDSFHIDESLSSPNRGAGQGQKDNMLSGYEPPAAFGAGGGGGVADQPMQFGAQSYQPNMEATASPQQQATPQTQYPPQVAAMDASMGPATNDSMAIPSLQSFAFPTEGSPLPAATSAATGDNSSTKKKKKKTDDDSLSLSLSESFSPSAKKNKKKTKKEKKKKHTSDSDDDSLLSSPASSPSSSLSLSDSLNNLMGGGSVDKEAKRKQRVQEKNKGLWATSDVAGAKKQGERRKASQLAENSFFTSSKKKQELVEKERRKSQVAVPDVTDLNSTTSSLSGVKAPSPATSKKKKAAKKSSFDESDEDDDDALLKSDGSDDDGQGSRSTATSLGGTIVQNDMILESMSFAQDPLRSATPAGRSGGNTPLDVGGRRDTLSPGQAMDSNRASPVVKQKAPSLFDQMRAGSGGRTAGGSASNMNFSATNTPGGGGGGGGGTSSLLGIPKSSATPSSSPKLAGASDSSPAPALGFSMTSATSATSDGGGSTAAFMPITTSAATAQTFGVPSKAVTKKKGKGLPMF